MLVGVEVREDPTSQKHRPFRASFSRTSRAGGGVFEVKKQWAVGEECKHGHLGRQCEVCERDDEINEHLDGTGHATLAEMRREFDAMLAEVAAWRSGDLYCDMLGYLAGEYEQTMDTDGVVKMELIRQARTSTDAARSKG